MTSIPRATATAPVVVSSPVTTFRRLLPKRDLPSAEELQGEHHGVGPVGLLGTRRPAARPPPDDTLAGKPTLD